MVKVSFVDGTMMLDWLQYKPVSLVIVKRVCMDFVNENIELVRKLSFSIQLSILMTMMVETFS